MTSPLDIVFLGLSVTSSWGNGHATNYRCLMKALERRGHRITFLERDVEWYAAHRDLPHPPFGTTHLYADLDELRTTHAETVRDADLVVVGSYVPEGVDVASWIAATGRGVQAFYDIDTPITLAGLVSGTCPYLSAESIARFDLYLSFTGGPTLDVLERRWGARHAVGFYCMVDEEAYTPEDVEPRWSLGYLGTYSPDRQPKVERLLLEPARVLADRCFVVAGPQYPATDAWPGNVEHIAHLAPPAHPAFYSAQRFTLNVTRAEMVRAGWSPSVRLFEAAACATPVISDAWSGIEHFFAPGEEILLADCAEQVVALVGEIDDDRRHCIADAARARVLREHTGARRAEELEHHAAALLDGSRPGCPRAGRERA
jgi:spore maturation protein CgeB